MKFNFPNALTSLQRLFWGLGIVVALAMVSTSCQQHWTGNEATLEEKVDSFADSYFNWQFHKAIKHVTPESEKWIRYAASQVHQADLELLNTREERAEAEIKDIEQINDTTAKVRICVHNYMRMDTIGKAGRMIDEADFTLYARHKEGSKRWWIHLTSLPRHEK